MYTVGVNPSRDIPRLYETFFVTNFVLPSAIASLIIFVTLLSCMYFCYTLPVGHVDLRRAQHT